MCASCACVLLNQHPTQTQTHTPHTRTPAAQSSTQCNAEGPILPAPRATATAEPPKRPAPCAPSAAHARGPGPARGALTRPKLSNALRRACGRVPRPAGQRIVFFFWWERTVAGWGGIAPRATDSWRWWKKRGQGGRETVGGVMGRMKPLAPPHNRRLVKGRRVNGKGKIRRDEPG